MEIERKFLIDSESLIFKSGLRWVSSFDIRQYYVVIGGGTEVRVRYKRARLSGASPKYLLTIKVGNGLKRKENEFEIPKPMYMALRKISIGGVSKVRYVTEEGFEFDVYRDKLAGLITVEKEFETVDQAEAFVPPAFFGSDVTEDKRYKNKSLATKGLPK